MFLNRRISTTERSRTLLVLTAYYKHKIIPDDYKTKKKNERASRDIISGL